MFNTNLVYNSDPLYSRKKMIHSHVQQMVPVMRTKRKKSLMNTEGYLVHQDGFKTQGNIESQPVSKSPVVFLIEEENRRFCLNHIKPLSHCSPNIWINQSCFLMSNWFSASQHLFTDKAMVITETPVPRTLLATSSTCSTKSLLDSS